jgi:pilus assembly protein CpaE
MTEKILIIDDDMDTLRLVGLMLQHQGYQISAASSGEQGIAKAESEKPDVILLDIMMPEMDGYEVTRRLKQDPRTQSTPILMFTAKTQLEDKVTGFQVGADDYLTKPTSPGELQSHIRQLLEHAREKEAAAQAAAHRGHAIAILGARGGLGISTLAMNLAAALHLRSQTEVILAEFTPGHGTLNLDLGMPSQRAFIDLLTARPEQITPERVNAALAAHSCGIRLLLASDNPREVGLLGQTQQFEAVFDRLASRAAFIVMDLGSALPPWAEKILPRCEDRIIVTDASPNTITQTRHLIDDLTELDIDPAAITVVLNNRVRFEAQMPWTMVQQGLGHPIAMTLSPAPEVMAAAARRHLPAVLAEPEDVTSQQILKIADEILAPRVGA